MKPAKLARAALIVALAAGLALAFANRAAFSQDALQHWLATAGWWARPLCVRSPRGATTTSSPAPMRSWT